jgi:myo-inositol-1(or 4)-monophosphatase
MTVIDFAAFVDQLASASGEAILPFFRTSLAVDNKKPGGFDPVTAADRAAENVMRALIRHNFPGHGIVGEEYAAERADAEYVWVLDPIDGTKSFIGGMPTWGTLIGLMRSCASVSAAMAGRRITADRPENATCGCAHAPRSARRCSQPPVRC